MRSLLIPAVLALALPLAASPALADPWSGAAAGGNIGYGIGGAVGDGIGYGVGGILGGATGAVGAVTGAVFGIFTSPPPPPPPVYLSAEPADAIAGPAPRRHVRRTAYRSHGSARTIVHRNVIVEPVVVYEEPHHSWYRPFGWW